MQRPTIVAVLGVDGSGKTTQTQLLAASLRRDGIAAAAYKNPGGRPWLNSVAHRFGKVDGPDLVGERAVVVLETVIRWLAIARALIFAAVTGKVAVMDRYSFCQYAIMRARGDRGERVVRRLFGVLPEPTVVCLLKAPPVVAQRRVELRGKDREDAGYLAALEQAYRSLPEFPRFVEVDASGQIDDVHRALRTAVDSALAGRQH
ncbi:MAG: hypothetical protein JHD16_13650 [Solirubrobacteraceae bacterium]|nr:hypothetical protein [Solirubrobacteraceae bacterium]